MTIIKDAVASLSEGQTLTFCRECANFSQSAFPAYSLVGKFNVNPMKLTAFWHHILYTGAGADAHPGLILLPGAALPSLN
jgi:hypothetical protein